MTFQISNKILFEEPFGDALMAIVKHIILKFKSKKKLSETESRKRNTESEIGGPGRIEPSVWVGPKRKLIALLPASQVKMNLTRRNYLLQASMSQLFFTLPKRLTVSPSPPLLHFNYRSSRTRLVCSNMSTESSPSPLTHSITILSQLSQPVHVVAAPGLSESDFRRVT